VTRDLEDAVLGTIDVLLACLFATFSCSCQYLHSICLPYMGDNGQPRVPICQSVARNAFRDVSNVEHGLVHQELVRTCTMAKQQTFTVTDIGTNEKEWLAEIGASLEGWADTKADALTSESLACRSSALGRQRRVHQRVSSKLSKVRSCVSVNFR
jgi:hypothetical protein